MAFNVTLYQSFQKPKNSTKTPSGGDTFPCLMVEPCGVINPRISFNQGVNWNPSAYNYAYIPDFSRYYWVNEWTFERGRWYVSLNVDPLSSWKSYIVSESEYVVRSASRYDTNVGDQLYPATAGFTRQIENFRPWSAASLRSGSYVVGILGDNDTEVGGISYFVGDTALLNGLFSNMLGNTNWIGQVGEISDELLRCLVNPMQYITSVMWLPLPFSMFDGGTSPVKAGWWLTGMIMKKYTDVISFSGDMVDARATHPQASRGNYLNYAPYTRMVLEFPPFGRIELAPEKYPPGAKISYTITIDGISGLGCLQVYSQGGWGSGETLMCKVGVDLAVGQSQASALSAAGSAVSQASSSHVGKAMSWALSHFGKIGESLSAGFNSIGDTLSSLSPELNAVNQNGGVAIYQLPGFLTYLFVDIAGEDNQHLGRPLCKKVSLSTLSGFTQCLDPDVNIPCTDAEHDMIAGYMSGGFYIE